MWVNYEQMMEDETGDITQTIAYDPLNLRQAIIGDAMEGAIGGFNLIDGHLFCPDSTVALAYLAPAFRSLDSKSSTAFSRMLKRAQKEFEASHPDVKVHAHGDPIGSVSNASRIKSDLMVTVGISIVLILIVIGLCFRSFPFIWKLLLPILYGTMFSLACIYWIKGGMSLMALGVGSVILGVALSYCLHVIVHQRFVGDVEQMLADEAIPVCLGCLTTIGAFLGLMFTQSELLKDFGLFATFALIGSTFFALVFLPHFLNVKDAKHSKKAFKLIDKINNYPYDRNPFIIIALCVFIVIGIIFSGKVQFDNDLKHIGYESDELHKSQKLYAEKNDHGGVQKYYAVTADDLDQALDANKALSATMDSLREAGDLFTYTPVVSILFQSQAEQERRNAAWKRYWTPEKVAEAMAAVKAAALKNGLSPDIFVPFQAMVEADYEPGNLYEAEVVPEGLLCNFIEETDGKFLILNAAQMSQEKEAGVSDIIAAMPHAVVVDPLYYTGGMISLIHKDFNMALLISSIFVFVVLLLSFRDILISLLAFMPMFLSWYVVQGWMAILGLQFNMINIVISTFIFGIGVDYSIFVMKGLIEGQRQEGSKLLEYHKVAIFFSALVLIIVMAAMLFAKHPTIVSIGECALIGMISTILITYTLQPLIFRWLMKIPFMKRRVEK
jgi:predicted RND superfamily exporter protein